MKKLFLLSLSALLIVGSYAQTNIRANQIVADDKFFPPVKDTTQTPGRVGQLTVRAADTSLYMAISITAPHKWIKIAKLTDISAGGPNLGNSNLSASASHTFDIGGFTQTFTNGTFLNDSIKFTNVNIYPAATSIVAYGNSITAGQNASPGDSAYIERYADLFGLSLDNHAVGGRGAWRATSEANATENPGDTKMATIMAGFNDVRRGGNDARTYNKVINAHKNIFVNHFLKSYESAGTGANVARYGTWTTTYPSNTIGGKSNAAGAFTTVLNDSIVYTFTDDNVVVAMIFGDGTTEVYSNSFKIYIDNVLQGTHSAKYGTDGISDGADGNTRQPAAFIYTGLEYGQHKIKLVNNESGKHMIVDYFGQLVAVNGAYPLIIWHAPKMDATGYATSPANASNAIIDALNTKLDSLVATFPAGYPVYVARTNDFYVNTTASGDLDVADHIHPTNQGHRHIYDAGAAVFSSFPEFVGTQRTIFWAGGRPWAIDSTGTPRPLVYGGEAAAVAGTNRQVQYNNSGSFGGGAGVEIGNTNKRLLLEAQSTTDVPLTTKGFSGQTANHYSALSSSNTVLFKVDGSGGTQTMGPINDPVGSGSVEVEYTGATGYVTSYNRAGASWQPLNFRGSAINAVISGTTKVNINGSGRTFFGGSTSATALVHLAAGTATASTAPLKFTSGTNLGTPEDGAVEFDGTHFYGTVGSTRYQLDQQSNAGTSGSYTPTLTNQTNISASSLFQATWLRIDSIVEVEITGQLTPTLGALTNSELRFTLPITTSSATNQAWVVTGTFIGAGVLGNQVTGVGGLISTTAAQFFFQSNSTSASSVFQIKFQYKL